MSADIIMGRTRSPRRLGAVLATWRQAGVARPPEYLALLTVVVVLNLVGLVMVLSASSVAALDTYASSWHLFWRQLQWVVLGALALAGTSRMDYRLIRRAILPMLAISALLLLAVLIPGLGHQVSGSSRWLGKGSIRFQPSEVAKLALVAYAAEVLSVRADAVGDWKAVLRPILIVVALFGCLVMLQPDMGTTIVMTIAVATVIFVGGVRLRHLALSGAGLMTLGLVAALAEPYRRARMLSFANPWANASDSGYQVVQSLIALGSGGWTGVGLGASRAKWLFLPNAHTDFIFAIIGEELGLVGCFMVLGLLLAFLVFGVRVVLRAPDRFGMLLAAGIVGWIVGQSLVNIGAVIGLLPVTGVPLPFISFGGSSLVIAMIATGMLLNIARQTRA